MKNIFQSMETMRDMFCYFYSIRDSHFLTIFLSQNWIVLDEDVISGLSVRTVWDVIWLKYPSLFLQKFLTCHTLFLLFNTFSFHRKRDVHILHWLFFIEILPWCSALQFLINVLIYEDFQLKLLFLFHLASTFGKEPREEVTNPSA